MKKLLNCRRSMIAIIGMLFLMILGIHNHLDVSMSIASIAIGIAGANAYSEVGKDKKANKEIPKIDDPDA